MGGTLSSKRFTANWSDDDQYQIRDGVRIDGKWEYQRVFEDASRCRSVRTGMFYL